MIRKSSSRRHPADQRGQMPFSMVAVVLILISSISALMLTDLQDSSEQAGMAVEQLQEMGDLSDEARRMVEDLSFQALLAACSAGPLNESSMDIRFREELDRSVQNAFPLARSGFMVEVDTSGVDFAYLRLPLVEAEGGHSGSFIPAYAGLCGSVLVKGTAKNGNLTKTLDVEDRAKVPWPLLVDRMQSFERSTSDGLGTLSSITNYLLSSLATYRALQGWGGAVSDPGEVIGEMVTERDVMNAVDLGLILLQYEIFRTAAPCYGMWTEHMDAMECWGYLEEVLSLGGTVDPADVFLRMYGYDEVRWAGVFAQTLFDAQDRISLRWMEWTGVMDVVNFIELGTETVYFTVNDLIDDWLGVDLA